MKAKVLLDGGDAPEQVIDFLGEPGEVLGGLFELVELLADCSNLIAKIGELRIDGIETVVDAFEFVENQTAQSGKIGLGHIETL